MSMNFFETTCQETPTNTSLFGLCDDQNGLKAYTNTSDSTKWIATVKNDSRKRLTFTAIDKCVIKDHEQIGRGRCDGMLTSSEHLLFIELKDIKKGGWVSDAIEQLESTVKFFKEHHDVNRYRHKKAYACNKQKGHFREIDNEFNLRFFRKYKFRIDVQAEIIII